MLHKISWSESTHTQFLHCCSHFLAYSSILSKMAYASLVCLSNTIEQNLQLHLIPQNSQYIQTLLHEASFFQEFLEKSSNKSSKIVKCLESRIRDISYKAQDIVDSHVADRLDQSLISLASLFKEPQDYCDEYLFQDLDEVMKEIISIKQEVMQIEEKDDEDDNNDKLDLQPRILAPAGSPTPPSHGMTTMVGLDDDFKQIKTQLGSGSLQLEIIAVVGMGGIGKTTLAKKVYDNKSIGSHFHTCRWVTVSQEYSMQSILMGLLGYDNMSQENNENLGLDLYQSLKNRRYLIVLDDMWDTKVWDGLKRVLPNDDNGSRILLTTRLEQVAKHENFCPPKYMRFLNNEESWGLFCEKVFGIDCCPPRLEEVGKEIVKNCRGLPLAIKVIGGHLSKETRSEFYWRRVAKNLRETITSEDEEQCARVLSLSYKHLPHHLKGCFLYMSVFPEDDEIEVNLLVHLWIASGFINQERSRSFEDVAKEYFLDLVERSLILVSHRKYNGKIMTCNVHDLIWDLCVKEAKKEGFFHITDKTLHHGWKKDDYYVHFDGLSRHLRAFYFDENDWYFQPTMVNHLAHLRYMCYIAARMTTWDSTLFHELLHLHTIDCVLTSFPLNIWDMPQLRHVKSREIVTPDPPPPKIEGENSVIVLEKLQTLNTIKNLILTDEVLQRIPNLKKLGIKYLEREDVVTTDWRDFGLNNLERLHKLESLECTFDWTPVLLRRDITFPHFIKKLTLRGCHSPWEEMTVIGSLPNLQVLKLKHAAFVGEEWKPNEGEFRNLKTLFLWNLDLVHWRAEADHFPELQHLFIQYCRTLQEIPTDIGEIPTLQLIQLYECGESVYSSAKKIEEEQHNFGNEDFQVITELY